MNIGDRFRYVDWPPVLVIVSVVTLLGAGLAWGLSLCIRDNAVAHACLKAGYPSLASRTVGSA